MIELLERLSAKAHKDAGWPGLLIGDMAQPRGGPMITGHASHQIGLDADVWLTPMPDHRLSREEREDKSAVMMVRSDRLDVDSHVWTPGPSDRDPRCGTGAAGATHLRQSRDQEAQAVPRSHRRPWSWSYRRCGRSGATTIISISASPAPPAARNANRNRRHPMKRAASPPDFAYWSGQGSGCCIRSPRRSRATPSRGPIHGATAGRLPQGPGRGPMRSS